MKLPPFNHAEMEWDSWRAFHITHHSYNKFVQFDTGELVVCYRDWRPDHRQVYKELHIHIAATDDDHCPRLYLPGMATVQGAKPIPRAHLTHKGQQIILLDLDHKRAVSVDRRLDNDNAPSIPERFMTRTSHRDIVAYYAGPKATPIGTPINRYFPQPLTSEQRTHVGELTEACKVWLAMQSDPETLKKKYKNISQPRVGEFVDVSFGVLTMEHRIAIALHNGFDMIIREKHDWLTFNTLEEWTNDEADDD